MGLLEKLFRQAKPTPAPAVPEQSDRTLKKETFAAVGVVYLMDNVSKLAEKNPDWGLTAKQIISADKAGTRIYRYNYIRKPVKLIPDPTNEYDRNAVNVVIAGEHVGWIGQEQNVRVLDILKNHEIKYITAHINGGEYKVVGTSGDTVKSDDYVTIRVHIGYV